MSGSSGAFSLRDMRTELAEHEGLLAEDAEDWMAMEQVARTRRWLDEGDQRALFSDAAAQLERNWREHGTGSRGSWAVAGGLWRLAGDGEQAERALRNAVADGLDWEPAPQGAAGVLYALGDFDRAGRLAPDDPEGWMAAAARDRSTDLVDRARERWIGWKRLGRSGPHQDRRPIPFSTWDWIEEAFRLEAELRGEAIPSHLEMLRRTGLQREDDASAPVAATRPALRLGFRVVLDGESDGALLEVRSDHNVHVALSPAWVLNVGRYFADEGWGVQSEAGAGDWVLSPSEPDFQSAAEWAADWLELRDEPEAARDLRRLVAAHDAAS